MSEHEMEIKCEMEALDKLSHGHKEEVLRIVLWHNQLIAKTFRNIIDSFELEFGRVPTPDELILKTNKLLGIDLDCIMWED